jgi:pyruvate dehydrogenase E1 component alpha subunit
VPRDRIQLSNYVEKLSILDENGNVDDSLDPKISGEDLCRLYRAMLLARRFDERLLRLQRQGRVGTFGPAIGQEAVSLGAAYAIEKDDWFIPCFREIAGQLYLGLPMDKYILYWGGNEEGNVTPEGVRLLPNCVPIATQCLHAAGIAWGCKLKGEKTVAVAFVGDGGTSEGDFHEALNCAGVFRLPLVTIIQNNQWAISLPRSRQTASETIAQKALAYGFNGIQADGNDILAMIVAVREAVERARSGGGPSLIEAITYRLGAHTTADEPKKYRTDEDVEPWKPREPLVRFWTYLQKKQIMDEKGREALENEINELISAAVDRAEAFKPDPKEPFRHCFAEVPNHLREQLREFQAFMAASAGEGRG